MNRFGLASIMLASLSLTACSNAAVILDQNPQGHVAGQPWAMNTAIVTHPSVVIGGSTNDLQVTLYPVSQPACQTFSSEDHPTVLFTVPPTVGVYPLRFDLTDLAHARVVNFSPTSGQNDIATNGEITVDAVSATEITLGVVASVGSHDINGRFTASICPAS